MVPLPPMAGPYRLEGGAPNIPVHFAEQIDLVNSEQKENKYIRSTIYLSKLIYYVYIQPTNYNYYYVLQCT